MFEPSGPTTQSQLRVFSACCAVFAVVLAWSMIRTGLWPPQRTVQWIGLAFGAVGAAGLLWPPSVRPIYRAAMVITRPIGFVVAQVLLSLLYFLVLTPVALLLRATGHDPLQRRPPGSWRTVSNPTRDLRRAFRQY